MTFPLAAIASGIVLDGWLIGASSATALLAGDDDPDTGGWKPGDTGAATAVIGSTGAAALLSSAQGPADEAAARMTNGYLNAMAVALTSGADADLAAPDLGAALGAVRASTDLTEGLVLNEVAEASASACKICYIGAGADLVDIVNGPDACPACQALAESNPHEPGLVPVHPRCVCSQLPHQS